MIPWEVTPEIIEKTELYASRGLKVKQIADAFGVCRDTFHKKRKLHPDLADALKKGMAKGVAYYAEMLLKKAESGSVASIIFFLKTKGEFIEKSHVKHYDGDKGKKTEVKEAREITKKCKKPKQ